MINVLGFKELFPNLSLLYDKLLEDIPADITISLLSSLNNELNTSESEQQKQIRLREIISYRFSPEQKKIISNAYARFKSRGPQFSNFIFGRRYLLAMLISEVKINRRGNPIHDTPQHEFNFFLAYLQIIDEVNETDHKNLDVLYQSTANSLSEYKLLWPSYISQFEFNQKDNGPFGLFKLVSFCKYAYDNFKPFLKEYLLLNNFKNISQFISSFYQVAKASLNYHPEKLLRKDNRILPLSNVDTTHLKSLCINHLLGTKIFLADLRKFPLYETNFGQFRVLDETMYFQKLYKGPFFELYQETSLKETKTFNEYSSEISKKVVETICFNGICGIMQKTKHDQLHFDDNTQSQPDCYYRHNKKILLIEFKDYLFPAVLASNPEFEEIKKYIDERFIKSAKGKSKGINQLLNYIRLLRDNKYQFDNGLHNLLNANFSLQIYPVICYSDFMFNMPGVNDYINKIFQNNLKQEDFKKLQIKPVIMVNIEVLFDYTYRSGNFNSFVGLIDRYLNILNNRTRKLGKEFSSDNFLKSKSSFDEIYNSIFIEEFLKKGSNAKPFKNFAEIIGITQQEMDLDL